ncbi:hypothetical protein [Agathobaculum sp.]|uniref:hypothetical protein n=1 Tax=Agathobaculum sp. TaxID=2048138 RepID=UPI0035201FD9
MQKGDIAKLKLLLAGISARMTKIVIILSVRSAHSLLERKNLMPNFRSTGKTGRFVFRAVPRPRMPLHSVHFLPLRLKNLTRACLSIPNAALS